MATIEQIEILMAQVGPLLDPLAIDAFVEDRVWGIALEEDQLVFVKFNEKKNCLVFSIDLGQPPAGDRSLLYEILLQINFHWDATGGVRMGVNAPDGEVVQAFEIGADELDAARLSETLSSFAEVAVAWREVVRNPASVQTQIPDLPANLAVRV